MEIDVCAKGGDFTTLGSCIKVDLNMILKEPYNAMVRHSSEAGPAFLDINYWGLLAQKVSVDVA